jgi:dCMP deaminase
VADWDGRFMGLALHVGEWSKDRSKKVGCVIVGPANEVRSIGYNGFPRDIDDDEPSRHERPAKYSWTEHAERNAIYNTARIGVPIEGCRMYVPWFPCMDCARAIVQSGLKELIAFEPDFDDPKWGEDFKLAILLLKEGGVQVRFLQNVTSVGSQERGQRLSQHIEMNTSKSS